MSETNLPEFENFIDNGFSNDHSIYHVRLTDSALKNLERLSAQSEPTFKLSISQNKGKITIPSLHERPQPIVYSFSLSKLGSAEGINDCLQLSRNSTLSYGKYVSRITIEAKDDSFSMARERMAKADNELKKNSTKTLNEFKHSKFPSAKSSFIKDQSKNSVNPKMKIIQTLSVKPLTMVDLVNVLRKECQIDDVSLLQKIILDVSRVNKDGYLELLSRYQSKSNSAEKVTKISQKNPNNSGEKSPRKSANDILQESDSENNYDMKRVSTAPRLPGSRSRLRASKKENNPFLKDFVQSQIDTQLSSVDDYKRVDNSLAVNTCLISQTSNIAKTTQGPYIACSVNLGSGGESSEHTPCSGSSSIINQNSTPFTQESPKNLITQSSTNNVSNLQKNSLNITSTIAANNFQNNHRLNNTVNNNLNDDVKKSITNTIPSKIEIKNEKHNTNSMSSYQRPIDRFNNDDEMDISDCDQTPTSKPYVIQKTRKVENKSYNIDYKDINNHDNFNQDFKNCTYQSTDKSNDNNSQSLNNDKICQNQVSKAGSRNKTKRESEKELFNNLEPKKKLKIHKKPKKSHDIEFIQSNENPGSNPYFEKDNVSSALNLSLIHKKIEQKSDCNNENSPSIFIDDESMNKIQLVHCGISAERIFSNNDLSLNDQTSNSYNAPNQLFSEAMVEQYQAEIAEINQLYPRVNSKSLAKNYRLEFELLYPDYLSAHKKSNDRWEKIRAIYNQIKNYKTVNNPENRFAITQSSQKLQDLIDQTLSPQLQSQEMKLNLMAYKLKLLKSHLYNFYSSCKISSNIQSNSLKR